jgi:hypothetical protein
MSIYVGGGNAITESQAVYGVVEERIHIEGYGELTTDTLLMLSAIWRDWREHRPPHVGSSIPVAGG